MPAALDKTVVTELHHVSAVLYSLIGEIFCVKKVGLKTPFRCAIMAAWNRTQREKRCHSSGFSFCLSVGEERVFLNRGWGYTFLLCRLLTERQGLSGEKQDLLHVLRCCQAGR